MAVWLMNGLSLKQGADVTTVSTDWSISKVGDYDGDGSGDLLWHQTSGTVALWMMNGVLVKSGVNVTTIPADWAAN